jgi:Tfp pilus assembly protein PilE
MIVVVITGILAAVAIPSFSRVARASKEAEAGPIVKQVYTLQERYRARHGEYATTFDDLEGAAAPVRTATYYQFGMSANGIQLQICARPRPGLQLTAIAMDERGIISIIDPASCTPS